MYKLIFSDLDETLLVDHHVPSFNIEAIKKACSGGAKFIPTTGRAHTMIDSILAEIGTLEKEHEYTICFNGGLIMENKCRRILNFVDLPYEIVVELFHEAKKYDVCILIFTLELCYIYNPNSEEIERKIRQKANFKVIDNDDISLLKGQKIAKMIYQNKDLDYLKMIGLQLSRCFSDKITISYSSNRYLEFNPFGIDKGFGLRWLTNYLNCDISETIAIGDNYNDIEMLKTAALGACVASANSEVKDVANYVTQKDYYDGAVKEVLEKFVLKEDYDEI